MIESLYSVVVNWNLKEDTLACVESLFDASAKAGQVIVVDNGSTDGSVVALRERFESSAHVVTSEKNLGYAGGANLGIEFALSRNAKWVLLLNNDTHVAPTFLTELENATIHDNQFAIIGPVILYHDSPKRIWYFGDRLIRGSLATQSLFRENEDRNRLPPLVPVDFISGCAMLVKSDVFRSVGFFDIRFFMYGEEVDFIWRARGAGYRVAVATRAKMWHKVSASANRDQPTTRYLRTRNQNRFYRTYARGLQIPLMLGFSAGRVLRVAVSDVMRGQGALIPALLRGWLHGWQKRQGRLG